MPRAEVTGSRVRHRDVLALREYRGVWLSEVTSILGDQLARIALSILIFERTDDAFLASLAFAVSYLPALVAGALSAGLTDLIPRRRLMVYCDLLRAGLVGLMCMPGMPIGGLLVILFVVSAIDAPFGAARGALVQDVLSAEQYPVGQSLFQATSQFGQIIGLAVGGAVVSAFSARGALVIDALTFVVSAGLLLTLVKGRRASQARGKESYWATNIEGARIIARSGLLRTLLGLTVFGLALLVATEGLAVSYAHQVGGGSVATGLLAASVPTGMALGLLAVGRVVPATKRVDAIRLLYLLWPIPLVATIHRPPVAVACLLWGLAGALSSYQLLANVMFAEALPTAMRGRAFSFAYAAIVAAQGCGVAIAGVLADATDPALTFGVLGLVGIVASPFFVSALVRSARGTSSVAALDSSLSTAGRQRSMPVSSAQPASRALMPGPPPPRKRPSAMRRVADRARWRSVSSYGLAFAVVAGATFVVSTGHIHDTTTASPVHWSWWILVPMLLATEFFAVPVQRGAEITRVALTPLPIVLGLFLCTPSTLFFSVVIATAVLEAYYVLTARRYIMTAVNIASHALLALSAEFTFSLFRGAGHFGWTDLLGGFVAALAADNVQAGFMFATRRLYTGSLPPRQMVIALRLGNGAGMVAASLGLLAVVAMRSGASYGWLLLVVGSLVIAGSRAYADLLDRHRDLGQLYAFAERLGPLLPEDSEVWVVLEETRTIMNATALQLVLDAEVVSVSASGPRGQQRALEVDINDRRTESLLPEVNASLIQEKDRISVALVSSGQRLGTLTAIDRLGHLRGFRRADLQLLATLGGRVADALEKGLLLGRLQDAATHDRLTGLLTLAELSSRLDEQLLAGSRHLVMLIDVARLKDVNDSLGHEAGDALLRSVALRIGDLVPPESLLARSGGGEFAVAIPNVGPTRAPTLVEIFTEELSGLIQVLGVSVDLRTRSGWVLCPVDAVDASAALRRADLALGHAKRGLARSAAYSPSLEIDGLRRLRLVNDLRDAIERRELDVVYQPLVTPRNGNVIGAEALCRWTHRELGPLAPDEFIVLAEQSALIGKLTELVLDKALAQANAWAAQGRSLRIAVNLSARCLSDLSMPAKVLELLSRHRVDPGQLILEVTETSVAEDPIHAGVVLDRLRALGLRLSIDDFGTGYSSLASLKRFPVQEVKLDRQFIVDFEAGLEAGEAPGSDSAVDVALITAIVTLGHSLGLEIVAEGIETRRVYERLRDLGVDVLQGYLIGRPARGELLPATFKFSSDQKVPPRGARV